ncbi:putative membrane protein [Paenibacillus sp. DS2015]
MIIFKKYSFWLFILSLSICLFNLYGDDDKNLLLFLTSPLLLWLNPWLTTLHYSLDMELLWLIVLYGIHLFSWLFIGLLIDWLISGFKAKSN